MKNLKVNIIGASGTGKTTLGKALASYLQCSHFDSDDYYHFPTDPPFQVQWSPEERLRLLMSDLNQVSSWVLSGGAGAWEPPPQLSYSLIVFMYLPMEVRLERLRLREMQLYGKRIMRGGDMEEDHKEFLLWTAKYDDGSAFGTNTLPTHRNFIQNASCPVLKFEDSMATEDQVEQIMNRLK